MHQGLAGGEHIYVVLWNVHHAEPTHKKYSWSVGLYVGAPWLFTDSSGCLFLALIEVIPFLVRRTLGWFKASERRLVPASTGSSGCCKNWGISEPSSSEYGWYTCYDTPVISFFGVMSCLFLRGHQLRGMSNCSDWYKMWKGCPRRPACPRLNAKACRPHKNAILIAITGCRLLIPVGTCVSLRKEQPLQWGFSMLFALPSAPPQWHILSCAAATSHATWSLHYSTFPSLFLHVAAWPASILPTLEELSIFDLLCTTHVLVVFSPSCDGTCGAALRWRLKATHSRVMGDVLAGHLISARVPNLIQKAWLQLAGWDGASEQHMQEGPRRSGGRLWHPCFWVITSVWTVMQKRSF